MQPLALSTLFFALLAPLAVTAFTPRDLPNNLTVTALVGKNNLSSLECWALTPALVESTATGTVGALSYAHLGATGNSSYSLFTQHTNAGLHNAPAHQYVFLLTGGGELSFPSADLADSTLSGNFTVSAGDILIATDIAGTSARGHNSVWQAGTSVLQMPFAGDIPGHVVLYDGGCSEPHM
ncbi:small secreted protein [Mycena amicta]|nr:small secreted protein [Mycena amicta]